MIEQLIKTAQEQLGGQLLNAGLNQSQLGGSMNVAKDTILNGLKAEALGGNMNSLLSLFNGKTASDASNSFVGNLIKNYASNLIAKLGLSQDIASTVSNLVIPFVMKLFAGKESGTAANGNQLMSLLGLAGDSGIATLLGGGKKGGLLGGLKKLFGK